jgi:hypothetical protein
MLISCISTTGKILSRHLFGERDNAKGKSQISPAAILKNVSGKLWHFCLIHQIVVGIGTRVKVRGCMVL